jgi:hypothetical protein
MIDRTKHPNIVFKEEFVSVTRNGQTTLEKYCNYYNNPIKALESALKTLTMMEDVAAAKEALGI